MTSGNAVALRSASKANARGTWLSTEGALGTKNASNSSATTANVPDLRELGVRQSEA